MEALCSTKHAGKRFSPEDARQDHLASRRWLAERLAAQGMAVVFISSEMSEVVRVSQRILVLRDRRPIGELPAGSSEDAVYELIADEHV
mgnify:CR=1 FL=1